MRETHFKFEIIPFLSQQQSNEIIRNMLQEKFNHEDNCYTKQALSMGKTQCLTVKGTFSRIILAKFI
jgi:hypothetical protein